MTPELPPASNLYANIGKATGRHPDEIQRACEQLNNSAEGHLYRQIFCFLLEGPRQEKLTKLRKVEPEDLKHTQGFLDALDLSQTIIRKTITP